MKWHWSLLLVAVIGSQALAQENPAGTSIPPATGPAPVMTAPPLVTDSNPPYFSDAPSSGGPNGFLTGSHDFPRFIGFLSNPIMNIDPRSVTEFYPVFMSNWTSAFPPLSSSGDVQLYGAGLTVA